MKILNRKINISLLLLVLCLILPYSVMASSDDNLIHIAVAGPFSTEDSVSMNHITNGVNLYLDSINNRGGINGKKVVIDLYDDKYDPEIAINIASEISQKSNALAVIGHLSNSCSMAASEIYKERGLVAITPTATTNVNKSNNWFFQTIFENDFQGKFLSKYLSVTFEEPSITIVYDSISYNQDLVKAFESVSKQNNLKINNKIEIDLNNSRLENIIKQTTNMIVENHPDDIILLAVDPPTGSRLLTQVCKSGSNNIFFLPHDYSYSNFIKNLVSNSSTTSEKDIFLKKLYMVTPLQFDIGGKDLEVFSVKYRKKYKKSPNWVAVMAYEATKLAVEAFKNSNISGNPSKLTEDRKKVKENLQKINSIKTALTGITGPLYFDQYGNTTRKIDIGVFRDNDFVSAPIQFRSIIQDDLSQNAYDNERVIYIDGYPMLKTNVVFTGVRTKKIEEINLIKKTFIAEFYLWFRYNGDFDLSDIDFQNAVEPINVGEPIDEVKTNNETYQVFHIRGLFKLDHIPSPYNKHIVAISFLNKKYSKNNLIFAIDWPKMYEHGSGTYEERLKQVEGRLLDFSSEWNIKELFFFQGNYKKHTLGSPVFTENTIDYSQFNLGLVIEKNRISMRGLITGELTKYYLITSFMLLIFFAYLKHKKIISKYLRILWFIQAILTVVLLITFEEVISNTIIINSSTINSQRVNWGFDILWWYLPAHLLGTAVARFIWEPLEKKTSQKIPTLLRSLVVIIFFVLSSLAVVAFVLQYKITSLLATSGVIAMIIGLALQINIANIFSGIALNLERPFKIGDWIMVHGRTPLREHCIIGCVVDIGWRTCRLKTTAKSLIIIPNNVISEKTVTNFMLPTETSRFELLYQIDHRFEPEIALKAIRTAIDSIISIPESGILKSPKYSVRLNGPTPLGIEYEVRYHIIPRVLSPARARHKLNQAIIEHLSYVGIKPAYPTHNVSLDDLEDIDFVNKQSNIEFDNLDDDKS